MSLSASRSDHRPAALIEDVHVARLALKDDLLSYRACTRGWAAAFSLGSPAELVGLTDFDLLARDAAREQLVLDSRVMSTGEARIDAFRLPPGGEEAILVRLPLRDRAGRIRGLDLRLLPVVPGPDAVAPYPVANYRALVNEGLQGSLIISENTILFANGSAAYTLGYETAESLMRHGRMDRHLERREIVRIVRAAVHGDGASGRLTVTAHARGGRRLRLLARATRVWWDMHGAVLLSFIDAVLPQDSSRHGSSPGRGTRRANSPAAALVRRLRANEQRLSHFAHAAADFFWEMDASLRFRFLSGESERVLGIERAELIGESHGILCRHPASLDPVSQWDNHRRQLLARLPFRDMEFRWRVDGEEKVIRYSGLPLFDARGRFAGYRGTGCDVTALVRQAEIAAYHASHDNLTELYNRRYFEEVVGEALESVRLQRHRHVLCFLDLDNFKAVNDAAGHSAGDELLRQLARRLDAQVRTGDALARIGGDEFALLMRQCELADGLKLANQIRAEVEQFRLHWQQRRFSVGVSIGVVPVDDRWGSREALFAAADSACYVAKHEGRNRVAVYADQQARPGEAAPSSRRVSTHWVRAVRSALDESRVGVVWQPLQKLRDPDSAVGDSSRWYEALLRLRTEENRWVEPASFLPSAERHGLVTALDLRAVELVVEQLATCLSNDGSRPRCSINIGSDTLQSSELLDRLGELLAATEVHGEQICLEIGEIALLSNLPMAVDFMQAAAPVGCRFGVDGFGTGLSSFMSLRHVPIDFIKIDGALMRGIDADVTQRKLLAAVIEIAHSLDRECVLTAVESAVQLDTARALGADYAQGFHVGRPRVLSGVMTD